MEVVSISGALSLSLVILMKVLFPSQVVLWKFFSIVGGLSPYVVVLMIFFSLHV